MLGVFVSNVGEARRRSVQLLEHGVPHKLFGAPGLQFHEFPAPPACDGGFIPVTCIDPETCAVSPDFVEILRKHEITEVVSAGTLESIVYALPTNTGFSFERFMTRQLNVGNFPSRREILTLEDMLEIAEIARRPLHDFLPAVGPTPGFHADIGPMSLSLEAVNDAVDRTRQRIEAFLAREAGAPGRRGIERVALTVISSEGELSQPSEGNTDACIEEWGQKYKDPQLGPRLLIKIGRTQQSRLDPSAIGPETVHLCRQFGFDGIVLSIDGLIFDREETLLAAATQTPPLPIFGASVVD